MKKTVLLLGSITCMLLFPKSNSDILVEIEDYTVNSYYEFNNTDNSNYALGLGSGKVVEETDSLLNKVYKELTVSLNVKDKENLINSQRSWIIVNEKFSSGTFETFSDSNYFGRMGILLDAPTIDVSFSESRILFLNTYADRNNNRTNSNINLIFLQLNFNSSNDYRNKSIKE